jgi:hypothetical protein
MPGFAKQLKQNGYNRAVLPQWPEQLPLDFQKISRMRPPLAGFFSILLHSSFVEFDRIRPG